MNEYPAHPGRILHAPPPITDTRNPHAERVFASDRLLDPLPAPAIVILPIVLCAPVNCLVVTRL
ncbi:hypothetical protein BO82DRAFT_169387 [Aspergillus uvarum CBS 121591]|uniref:Uncharacterized protein n=1 Tax=Aspergillus uvarum CBS 121591 TaxID=1448315 RepID=A0A319CH92_9EURO|nr:hypothetical protein BO82DRAFT_169387 [Aspergillus uvarum CBS 121591]PYH78003.1 hypothetical protein BO82DRAFT_169387 [Aspergillus uvarum CBS 121591]